MCIVLQEGEAGGNGGDICHHAGAASTLPADRPPGGHDGDQGLAGG